MKKENYERPLATIIEFELDDKIAFSAETGPDLICGEGLFD